MTLLIGSLRAGGAERQVSYLASGLVEADHADVTVALIDRDAPVAYPLHPEVRVVRLGRATVPGLFRAWWTLRRAARDTDVLCSFMDLANLLSALTRSPARRVWSVRTDRAATGWKSRIILRAATACWRRADACIANSPSGRAFYQQLGVRPEQFDVLPNAVDTEQFAPDDRSGAEIRHELNIPPDAVVVGSIARAHPDKRHDLLVDVFRTLRPRIPETAPAGRGRRHSGSPGPASRNAAAGVQPDVCIFFQQGPTWPRSSTPARPW